MDKFRTFIKEAAVNPQSHLTKKQRQALASPAARAKPKDQVTLAKMPWDKDKKKDEAYGCSSKRKKTSESIGKTAGDHSYHYLQKAKRLASADGHDYDKLPAYDRTHNKHKDYYDNKARNESKKVQEVTSAEKAFAHHKAKLKHHTDQDMFHTKKARFKTGDDDGKRYHYSQADHHRAEMEKHEKKMKAAAKMMKKPTNESVELDESTNWKGGSQHIGLARYSARNGYGVQITQIKAMPGDKMNWANGAGFVKMPVKDIPKLCKALMNVYKAPANAQMGDDD